MLQNNFTWVCSQSLPITMWEIVEKYRGNSVEFGSKPIQVYDVDGAMIRFYDSEDNSCKGYPGEFFRSKEDAEGEILKRIISES